MKKMNEIISTFLLVSIFLSGVQCKMVELYRWKQMSYDGIPEEALGSAVDTDSGFAFPEDDLQSENTFNQFVPYNNVPMGALHYKGRLFITMPRRRMGIPSTLNYIDMARVSKSNASPHIRPYPDYETNKLSSDLQPNPDRIISVYRMKVDACKRLWFIDTGLLEIPNNRTQIQRPSIWIINLETNQRVRRFKIPTSVAEMGNGLASIAVDCQANKCEDAFAYIPDLSTRRLSVYSFRENKIWTFSHNYFSFDPIHGDFDIGGQQFQWDDGIFSITLGPIDQNGYRTAYFLAMASISEFSVNTRILQNEAFSTRSNHGNDFKHLGYRGKHKQTTMHEYDKRTGVIVYAEIGRSGFGCWNTNQPFTERNFDSIDQNNVTMFYAGDLTIDEDGVIWSMTNSMPRFIYSQLDVNEYNFRIWRNPVRTAIQGTKCTGSDISSRLGDASETAHVETTS